MFAADHPDRGELRRDDFVGGDDCLHPDDSGYKKIARLFINTLR